MGHLAWVASGLSVGGDRTQRRASVHTTAVSPEPGIRLLSVTRPKSDSIRLPPMLISLNTQKEDGIRPSSSELSSELGVSHGRPCRLGRVYIARTQALLTKPAMAGCSVSATVQ